MKRGFVFFVVIIAILMYLFMNQQYYQLVASAKENYKSNQKMNVSIISIEGEFIEGDINSDNIIAKINKIGDKNVNYIWRLYQYSSPVSIDQNQVFSSFIATVNLNQVQFLSAKNRGGFDYDKYLYAKGITKQFKLLSIKPILSPKNSIILNAKTIILHKINQIIDASLNGDTNELIKALILGEKSSFEKYELYKSLGLAHIFAISGLHFGILYYFLKKILSFMPYNFSSMICFASLLLLIMIVGWPYSAQRAFFIICYNEVNQILGKKKDPYMSITFSLLIIILLQPQAVLSTSLHLSYYAYISIIIIFPQMNKFKFKNKILESFKFSIIIQLILLPASLYYFQKVNLYSFIANLIVVPIISVLLPICLLFIIIGLFGIKSMVLANLLNFLVYVMNQVSKLLPLKTSAFIVFKQSDFIVIVWIILLLFICHTIWRLYKNKRIVLIISSLTLVFIVVISEFQFKDTLDLYTFDVGHGDMALLTSKKLKVLVDTGDGKNNCEAILRGEGIHSLDALVISHAHNDHYGGAIELINNMKIKYLIINDDTYELLKDEITNQRIQIYIVKDQTITINESVGIVSSRDISSDHKLHDNPLNIEIIPILGANYLSDPNEKALIVRAQLKSNVGYLLGDISKEMINTIKDIDEARFVKSAHHGSSTSFYQPLYNSENLKFVITSCSNKYNMPNIAFEELLIHNRISHMTTYTNGEIKLTIQNDKMKIKPLIATTIKH